MDRCFTWRIVGEDWERLKVEIEAGHISPPVYYFATSLWAEVEFATVEDVEAVMTYQFLGLLREGSYPDEDGFFWNWEE